MDLATYLNAADVSFWNDCGIFTVEQYIRSGLEGEFSDAYKSARGFRPRGYDLSNLTNDQLTNLISEMHAEARANRDWEAEEIRLEREWMDRQDELAAEAAAENKWVATWQHYYDRLVGF